MATTIASETVRRDFNKIVTGVLQTENVYVKDGATYQSWIVLKKYQEGVNTDYIISVSQMRNDWCTIKKAIEAFHTTFTITNHGEALATLEPSEFDHPVHSFKPWPTKKGENHA